ncbi:17236_t:CDS:2 [Dentiscutata heterogama]|uniref:17236_t:CDS:1 n=1 Tax=Dentiscutata heterogama TaxID=1316150 RepID=A0ACA9KYE0_9GLOM|nr:17236_t:CDS:2 [Dentiscutata heterogama]
MELDISQGSTSAAQTTSSKKEKGKATAQIYAEAKNTADYSLPVLSVYKQKYVSISRALDTAEAKIEKVSKSVVGSLHDLKLKVPGKIESEVVTKINTEVHEKLQEHCVATLTDKGIENHTVPKNEPEKYWIDMTSNIAKFNYDEFVKFADTFQAKKILGDTPSMVGNDNDSDITILSENTNSDIWEHTEPIKTSKGPKAERQKTPKGQYQKGWQEIKKQFKNSLNKAKTNDVSLFYVNEKILDFSFDIISRQSINKINKNNFQNKSKFGINKKLEKAFDFLVENNLVSNHLHRCGYILPNSIKLINEVEKLKLPVTASLYTWDISSMYTNIDLDDLYIRLEEMLLMLKVPKTIVDFDINLLKWINSNSFIKYQNNWYKQYKGLAMGSSVSPVAANLYMERILIDAFGPLDNKIFNSVLYVRSYLDDVIAILDDAYGCDFVANRIEACAIPSNFELEGTCANKINFLDLTLEMGISLHEDTSYNYGYVLVSPYNKPTNVHAYTDTQSFYPYNYRYSWIQGENIRLIRNSGDLKSYNNALHEFKYFLRNRKYPIIEINNFLSKNDYNQREALLKVLKYKDNEFINKVDFILPLNNTPERAILVKMLKQVLKIYNCNASVQSNRVLRIALLVRSGQAIIDILNKAKKKVLHTHL